MVCASSPITSPLTSCTSTPASSAASTRSACLAWAGAVTKRPLTRAPVASASETACGPSARKDRSRSRNARFVSRRAAFIRVALAVAYMPMASLAGGGKTFSRT